MEDQPDIAVIATGAFQRLRDLQLTLSSGGFEAEIVKPPEAEASS